MRSSGWCWPSWPGRGAVTDSEARQYGCPGRSPLGTPHLVPLRYSERYAAAIEALNGADEAAAESALGEVVEAAPSGYGVLASFRLAEQKKGQKKLVLILKIKQQMAFFILQLFIFIV